ncbi:MAG: tRNA dimethylallyltransferase [Bacteroides sp. SM23_62]|nr:MAG: tRNA dimethylallyltransferase [Bacteroides sp. SM23_62]
MAAIIPYNLITVLGHTAGGKTRFAACLADKLNGEVISADSRQVYRHMDLGTGKDYEDYMVDGRQVPVHLIDILEPGYEYNVYEYQKDFIRVFQEIHARGSIPVLCGGSGLYIEAVLKGYRLIRVPVNHDLREELGQQGRDELAARLAGFKKLHNKTDIVDLKRLVRALEIEVYYREHPELDDQMPHIHPLILGIRFDRLSRRKRISQRLAERLDRGMIREVQDLLDKGVKPEKLIYYGLEYKYITGYLAGRTTYEEMFASLETAIHRFAKRQMTWFRKMERSGIKIHWFDGYQPLKDKIEKAVMLCHG